MNVDFLIVGSGLAGIHFAFQCHLNNKSFVVIDDHSSSSSRVAAGLYNPVILKRFTHAWHADEQLQIFDQVYGKLEDFLQTNIDFKLPLYRKFASIEEQNLWFEASDQPKLSPYLNTQFIYDVFNGIKSPFGFGTVNQTGFVNTNLLLDAFHQYLRMQNLLIEDVFDYDKINFIDNFQIEYNNISCHHIVYAEGYGLLSNPFFNLLPLDGSKGEVLVIECKELQLNVIVKSGIFIIPLGNHLFKVGATYHWSDKNSQPTESGRRELLEQLDAILTFEYRVVSHSAGIRPTVRDRKPLLGTHPLFSNFHVLNGLGTRGVMLAPYLAKMLFDFIENDIPLHKDVTIERFKKIDWKKSTGHLYF
jgi:glycine oxidase